MQITNKPQAYNFAGNLADIVIATDRRAIFTLSLDGEQLLSENYDSISGEVRIPLRSLAERVTPRALIDAGSIAIPKYDYVITLPGDQASGSFRCVRGGLASGSSAAAFMQANWLTWQPQSVRTEWYTPQRLVYAATKHAVVKAKSYYADGTFEISTYATLAADRLHTIETTYSQLPGKPSYVDLWVECDQERSYTQRYYLANDDPRSDLFVWYNTLGGIDAVSFTGDLIEKNNVTSTSAVFGDQTLEFDMDSRKVYTKYTGYIDGQATRKWVGDFFNSTERYRIENGERHRIVVSKPKIEYTRGEPAGYEFEFALSKQSIYLDLVRVERPEDLDIVDPDGDVFFLAPRLNEFERVDLAAGEVLIPCQYAAGDKWRAMSVSDLYAEIRGRDGQDAFFLAVFSEDGNISMNGSVNITLMAEAYRGEQNVTAIIPSSLFSWERRSDNTDGDIVWNELHAGVGPRLAITNADVHRKAMFECTVNLDGYIFRSNN